MGCLGKSRKVKRIHCFCFYVALGLFSLLHSSVLAFFHRRTAILISTLIGCYWLWEERREIFVSIHLGHVCEKSLKKFDFQYCCKEWRDWNKEKNRENVTANKESSALFKMHCCRGMSPDQSYICQVLSTLVLYCGTHNWLCVQKMLNHTAAGKMGYCNYLFEYAKH